MVVFGILKIVSQLDFLIPDKLNNVDYWVIMTVKIIVVPNAFGQPYLLIKVQQSFNLMRHPAQIYINAPTQ